MSIFLAISSLVGSRPILNLHPHLHLLVTEGGEDKIIHLLKLTIVAAKPPPPQVVSQQLLMAAETSAEYFS